MKVLISSLFVLAYTLNANGILCQEDARMENGSLNEATLTKNPDGTYDLQHRHVVSLNTPTIDIVPLGKNLTCRIDEKNPIAYCTSADGKDVVQIKERREVFFVSTSLDDKKTTAKYTDIVANGKTFTFGGKSCEVFNN